MDAVKIQTCWSPQGSFMMPYHSYTSLPPELFPLTYFYNFVILTMDSEVESHSM